MEIELDDGKKKKKKAEATQSGSSCLRACSLASLLKNRHKPKTEKQKEKKETHQPQREGERVGVATPPPSSLTDPPCADTWLHSTTAETRLKKKEITRRKPSLSLSFHTRECTNRLRERERPRDCKWHLPLSPELRPHPGMDARAHSTRSLPISQGTHANSTL